MIELSEHPDGRITRAFGGDTLNTAVYLARLGVPVDYVTALGDDGWSDEMMRAWAAEGVGTGGLIVDDAGGAESTGVGEGSVQAASASDAASGAVRQGG